jgi:hypothetical protein
MKISVREVDIIPNANVGAAMVQVYSGRGRLLLGYFTNRDEYAIICVPVVYSVRFGVPNDESLHEHPYYTHGLKQYGVFEVTQEASPLDDYFLTCAGSITGNCRHLVLTFKDLMVEVVHSTDSDSEITVKVVGESEAIPAWTSAVQAEAGWLKQRKIVPGVIKDEGQRL